MRMISTIMNMSGGINSMQREEDELVIDSALGESGAMTAKIYLDASDINQAIGAINWSTISFILLLPFFYVKWYLEKEDLQQKLFTFGLITAFSFILILLFVGMNYVTSYPLESGLLFFFFSAFYAATAIIGERRSSLHLSVFLLVISYFCFVNMFGFKPFHYPLFAILPVMGLFFAGHFLKDRKEEIFYPSLHTDAIFVTVYFTGYILININAYIKTGLAWAIIPVFAFSLFYLFRYLTTRFMRCEYGCLILFSLGFILLLYSLETLPVHYFGMFLIPLGFIMMGIGTKYHGRLELIEVSPLYAVGLIVSLAAFGYSVLDRTPLLWSLLFFSASLFTINRSVELKNSDEDSGEKSFSRTFFTLANVSASFFIIIQFYLEFPKTLSIIFPALGLSLLYLKVAYERGETVFNQRSQYIYLFGIFFAIFYFTCLARYNPLGNIQINMFCTIILLAAVLCFGGAEEKERPIIATSLYEVSHFVILVAFILPIIAKNHSLIFSSALAFVFLFIYLTAINFTMNKNLFYSFPIIFSLLYYNVLLFFSLEKTLITFAFIPPGLVAMGIALFLHRRESSYAKIFFFSWFLFSVISLYPAIIYGSYNIYSFAIWAASYLLGAELVSVKEEGEKIEAEAL